MSKARDLADFISSGAVEADEIANGAITSVKLANNLELSGDYVKVPVGNTASRPGSPTTGILRYNTDTGGLEQYNAGGWSTVTPVIITDLSHADNINAADPAGGETVVIHGSQFESGATVTIGGTAAASVTVNSLTKITITTPAKSAGDYDVVVTNTSGSSATLTNGISYDGVPSFTSPAAGQIGSDLAPNTAIGSITIVAAEPDGGNITFSVTSGSLPSGLSLAANGVITGTTSSPTSNTTSNFTVTATDPEGQTTTRNFNLVVLRPVYAYSIPNSLIFEDGDSAALDFTPPGGGSNKVWTFSAWFKRCTLTATQDLLHTGPDPSNQFNIVFSSSNDNLYIIHETGNADDFRLQTSQVFRDPTAWYHVVLAVNTTESTASNRVKLYINGEQITSFLAATYPSQNFNTRVNATNLHRLGGRTYDSGYFDGYMADVYLIDGGVKTPSDFGEFFNGVWVPKAYTGTFPNTSGWYLPMRKDDSVTLFNAVSYQGKQQPIDVNGFGFRPDLIITKDLDSTYGFDWFDTLRGPDRVINSNLLNAEYDGGNRLIRFNEDGFTLGNGAPNNTSGNRHIAYGWTANNTTTTNYDGTISADMRANPDAGFSILRYTGNDNSNQTVGHGLGATPGMIIIKCLSNASANWVIWHAGLPSNTDSVVIFTTQGLIGLSDYWDGGVTSSVFGVKNSGQYDNNRVGEEHIAYCWAPVAGVSDFGSYTGSGVSGNSITTGFKPAFVMIKCLSATESWSIYDSTRKTTNPVDIILNTNTSAAEYSTPHTVDFNDTGFDLNSTHPIINASGNSYIYAAFADTRQYDFWKDQSGEGNDWQPVNTGAYRITTDTPTG